MAERVRTHTLGVHTRNLIFLFARLATKPGVLLLHKTRSLLSIELALRWLREGSSQCVVTYMAI